MKKSLLFTVALGFAFGAFAQNERVTSFKVPPIVSESENTGGSNELTTKMYTPDLQAINCDTNLGRSANAFGSYSRGSRSLVYADPNLNTIVFSHRATATPGSGYIRFDRSTNGGATWTSDMTVYTPAGYNARYPQGVIYNPTGNTIPANAFFAGHGAVLTGSAAPWYGYYQAHTPLMTLTPTQTIDSFNKPSFPYKGLIPYCMYYVQNTGDVWIADEAFDQVTNPNDYMDTLIIRHGVWGVNKYNYTTVKFPAPVKAQATSNSKIFSGVTLAFNKLGTIGYIVMLGNNDSPLVDSIYRPIIYQTTNGGTTWGSGINVCINNLDSALNTGLTPIPKFTMISGADGHDAVVDANNNLHFVCAAGPASSNGQLGFFDGTPGRWGIFDFYTQGGVAAANTIKAQLLGKPETFSGNFNGNTANAITCSNRPQATINWNGDRIFFTWFDTDTAVWVGTPGNINPDAWGIAYNVTTNKWSAKTNLTPPSTCASGMVTFGSCPQFALAPSAGTWSIPLIYQYLNGGGLDATLQVKHMYVGGIQWTDAQITLNGTPIVTCGTNVGVEEHANNLFSVSNNFPNPFHGTSEITINMVKPGMVTIEIFNTLGEKVTTTFSNELSAGSHVMTIDGTKLTSGVYFYTVKSGEFTVTKKFVIE